MPAQDKAATGRPSSQGSSRSNKKAETKSVEQSTAAATLTYPPVDTPGREPDFKTEAELIAFENAFTKAGGNLDRMPDK